MWHDEGWGTGSWILMILLMVVFWGALIAVGNWLIRSADGGRATFHPSARPSAQETLALRYARGEIDEQEFARRTAELTAAGERFGDPVR